MNFTVLIPVYNTPPVNLVQAFYSVYKQDKISGYDVLIVDDGSTDHETLRIIDWLQCKPNVKVLRLEKNKGSAAARNAGIAEIKTDYIALMDSDDISHPMRFHNQWEYIKENQPDACGTGLFSFYDGDLHRKPLMTKIHDEVPEYNNGWMLNQGTVFLKREAVLKAGGYDEKLRRAQDIDLWKRMHAAGCKLRNIAEVLYAWRRYKT